MDGPLRFAVEEEATHPADSQRIQFIPIISNVSASRVRRDAPSSRYLLTTNHFLNILFNLFSPSALVLPHFDIAAKTRPSPGGHTLPKLKCTRKIRAIIFSSYFNLRLDMAWLKGEDSGRCLTCCRQRILLHLMALPKGIDSQYARLVEKFTPDNFPQVFNPFRPSII
jgi:hypothetical protein